MTNKSFIYTGRVIHRRFKPKFHEFKYNVFSLFLDLDELSLLDKELSFFSYNSFNLVSFWDKDHGDRDGKSLKNWVLKNLKLKNISYKNVSI